MNCQMCNNQNGIETPWGTFCISCLKKSKLCDVCNTVVLSTEVLVVGNQIVCRNCAGDTKECSKCSQVHLGGMKHRGKQYCDKCSKNFEVCSVCGKTHTKHTISEIEKIQYAIINLTCKVCYKKIKETTTPLEVFECKVCHKYHTLKTEYEDTPCTDCITKGITCICCGNIKHRIYNSNGSNASTGLCMNCYETKKDKWRYCNHCNDFKLTSEMGDHYCKKCDLKVFRCTICGNQRNKSDATEIEGEQVCAYCVERCKCTHCGKQTLGVDGNVCYSCCDTHKIIKINNYSFKPRFKMFGNGLYLGVENEIANVSGEDRQIISSVPRSWMFMKSDSSVENGVECVFHPTTLAYFQENKHIIENHFKGCDIAPHKSAGMHVHMSKDKFGTYQLFKFIQFFKEHTEFIDKIAERKSSYAKHLKEKSTTLTKFAKDNADNTDRYRSININNEKTIEVRIFAGVVTVDKFMKNIEFCDALYNFTKTSPHFKKGSVELRYFVAYVEKYKHIYPYLNVFLGGTPPKEVPEKYKVSESLVNTVVENETVPSSVEVQQPIREGLYEGCRVILTTMHHAYPEGSSNPVVGSPYFCEGVITQYFNSDGCLTRVRWDNGNTNTYFNDTLTTVGRS